MIENASNYAATAADREAIRDCLTLYARAIDRADAALLRDVFWPDAAIDAGGAPRSVEQFVEGSMASLEANWERVHHMVSNVLIRFDAGGDAARVEAYTYGYHRSNGEARDLIIAGRYLDRFEKRDGEWRVARRQVLVDWFREYVDSSDWETSPWVRGAARGAYGNDDPSCGFFEES